MSKKSPFVKELRTVLKNKVDFDFWVRADSKGAWVGIVYGNDKRLVALADALTKLGYSFECNGNPGTSGEYIIEVYTENPQCEECHNG